MTDCSFERIESLRRQIDEQLENLVLLAQYGYIFALFRNSTQKLTITDFLNNHEDESVVPVFSYYGYNVGRDFNDLYGKKYSERNSINQSEYVAEQNLFYNPNPGSDDETLASVHKKLRNYITGILTCLDNYVQDIILDPRKGKFMSKLRTGYNPDQEYRLYAYYAFYKWCKMNLLVPNDNAMFSLGLLYYAYKTTGITGIARGRSGRQLAPLEFLLHLFAKSAKHHASFPYNDEDIPTTGTEFYTELSRALAHERRREYHQLHGEYIKYIVNEETGETAPRETEPIHNYRITMGPKVKDFFVNSFLHGDGGAFALWNQYDAQYARFGRRKPKRKSRKNSKSKFGRPTKRSSAKKRTRLSRR